MRGRGETPTLVWEVRVANMFKVDTMDNVGRNWLIADFGTDANGEHYILTTDYVRGSESHKFIGGAKADAELVCDLLNEFYKDRNGITNVELPNNSCRSAMAL